MRLATVNMPLVFIGPKELSNIFDGFRSYKWAVRRCAVIRDAQQLEPHQFLTLAHVCEYENLKADDVLMKLGKKK